MEDEQLNLDISEDSNSISREEMSSLLFQTGLSSEQVEAILSVVELSSSDTESEDESLELMSDILTTYFNTDPLKIDYETTEASISDDSDFDPSDYVSDMSASDSPFEYTIESSAGESTIYTDSIDDSLITEDTESVEYDSETEEIVEEYAVEQVVSKEISVDTSNLVFKDHPFFECLQKLDNPVVLPYLHSSTKVNTPQGLVQITDLKDNDVILKSCGEEIVVEAILKIQPQINYIRFGRGSLQCKPPNQEPNMDLYVSPNAWFMYKHVKSMDCENIMNGNSISRTTIEMPADCYLICTQNGDFVRVADIDILTLPLSLFLEWYLLKQPSSPRVYVARRINDEWCCQ